MKYVMLIHSNPRPWGHPTGDYVEEHQALPEETRRELNTRADDLLTAMSQSGELLGGSALGDPTTARLYTWADGDPVVTDGPYSETKEHLAGFFLLDLASPDRAEEVGRIFAGPGETVELRPVMSD